jgi:hypothetical protein
LEFVGRNFREKGEELRSIDSGGGQASGSNEWLQKIVMASIFVRAGIPPDLKPPRPLSMLFRFSDVQDNLPVVMNLWTEKFVVLEVAVQLYFATRYNPHQFEQNTLLNLVQALETYHRKTMANNVLPPVEHHKRLSEVLCAIPEEHRTWAKRFLERSNEPSL